MACPKREHSGGASARPYENFVRQDTLQDTPHPPRAIASSFEPQARGNRGTHARLSNRLTCATLRHATAYTANHRSAYLKAEF